MEIKLIDLAKRFNYQVIFKNINYSFESGKLYAVIGSNGSGKSTLLKILSGFLSPTAGSISWKVSNDHINIDDVYHKINYTAPYIQIPEKLSLSELFDYHSNFKQLNDGLSKSDFIDILNLKNIKNKLLSDYSSGMQQRVKLALTFLFKSDCILLDEPLINLDTQGYEWYNELINDHLYTRTIIIASNDVKEHHFCDIVLNIQDYK